MYHGGFSLKSEGPYTLPFWQSARPYIHICLYIRTNHVHMYVSMATPNMQKDKQMDRQTDRQLDRYRQSQRCTYVLEYLLINFRTCVYMCICRCMCVSPSVANSKHRGGGDQIIRVPVVAHPRLQTPNPLNSKPQTHDILNPNPIPSILNPTPYTLDPEPQLEPLFRAAQNDFFI